MIVRQRGTVEQQLEYDADDHLVRIADPPGTTGTLWDFDAAGRRVRREDRTASVTTAEHRYLVAPTLEESLDSPHAVTTGGGAAEVGYVFAGEHPLLRYDESTNQAVYYLQDSMDSTIGLVDGSGAGTTIHYDGFGNETRISGLLAGNPSQAHGDYRFQGMWRDAGTALYYVRARFYEPESGRFGSRDSNRVSRLEAQDSAPYALAGERPTVFRDPSGSVAMSQLVAGQAAQYALATLAIGSAGFGFARGLRAAHAVDLAAVGEDRSLAFSQCIEDQTASPAVAGASVAVAAPSVPFPKALAVAVGLLERAPVFAGGTSSTNLASVLLASRIARTSLSIGAINGLRGASRFASAIATPLLIGEGFYDVGVIGGCASVFLR